MIMMKTHKPSCIQTPVSSKTTLLISFFDDSFKYLTATFMYLSGLKLTHRLMLDELKQNKR